MLNPTPNSLPSVSPLSVIALTTSAPSSSSHSSPCSVHSKVARRSVDTHAINEQVTMDECINRFQVTNSTTDCPPTFDGVVCWPPTNAGQEVRTSCSVIFSAMGQQVGGGSDSYAFRRCDDDGQWDWNGWTNYSECLVLLNSHDDASQTLEKTAQAVSVLVLVASLISAVALILAIIIFTTIRSLRCLRIRIHTNLCCSLLLHSLVLIAVSGQSLMANHQTEHFPLLCKSLKLVGIYSSLSSVNWMFIEGLVLHTKLIWTFLGEKLAIVHSPIIHGVVGWLVPALFTGVWSTVVEIFVDTEGNCWQGYGRSPTLLIVTAPMLLALAVNFIFLLNIVRVLLVKLRNDRDQTTLKTIKATAFLIPLLGLEHLFFCINPHSSSRLLETFYLVVNGLTKSTQGLAVAVLFCFTNQEVQTALTSAWRRRRDQKLRRPTDKQQCVGLI